MINFKQSTMDNNILLQWSMNKQPTTTAGWPSTDVLPRDRMDGPVGLLSVRHMMTVNWLLSDIKSVADPDP